MIMKKKFKNVKKNIKYIIINMKNNILNIKKKKMIDFFLSHFITKITI